MRTMAAAMPPGKRYERTAETATGASGPSSNTASTGDFGSVLMDGVTPRGSFRAESLQSWRLRNLLHGCRNG